MNWKEETFRYFIEGKLDEDGKTVPRFKTHGSGCVPLNYEQAEEKQFFGAILKDGYIDISFDDAEMGKAFLKMREHNQWNCVVLLNPLNEHIHTIWNNSTKKIKKNSGKDEKTVSGLVCDIHGGYTYIRLKEPTHERFPPVFVPENIEEVPDELMLVNTKKDLWNMSEGSGRNSELFGYVQVLQKQLHFTNDRIKKVIWNINQFILDEPLSDEELNSTVLRDESFEKYEVKPLNSISASDLLNMDIEPVYFAVKDLLPMGLSIIASPPKFGKSYLCTQLSLAVANGSEFLGFDTNKSAVLYMALEDSFNRCKDRLLQELQGQPAPKNLEIMIDCPSLGNGLIDQLQEYVKEHPDTKLIIIDTFQKIRDGSKSNEGAYSSDYREAGLVKKFADENKIAVLLVHHTRKMKDPSDPFANVSGTQGLTGACDTMLVLTKEKRVDDLTQLSITGRDVCQNEYAISRNKDTGIWMRHEESIEQMQMKNEIALKKYQFINGNLRKTILHLMNDKEQWTGRCSDIIETSKEIGFPITETSQKLSRILDEVNAFMIEEDNIYHSIIEKGTASKLHRFEKSS